MFAGVDFMAPVYKPAEGSISLDNLVSISFFGVADGWLRYRTRSMCRVI